MLSFPGDIRLFKGALSPYPHKGGWQAGMRAHGSVATMLLEHHLRLPPWGVRSIAVHIQASLCHVADCTGGLRPRFGLCSHPRCYPTPSQQETAPRSQKTKHKDEEVWNKQNVCSYPSLYWWLCSPWEPLPACSGQPLAHTFVGHTSDGGDLKEAAGTEGVSAGAAK